MKLNLNGKLKLNRKTLFLIAFLIQIIAVPFLKVPTFTDGVNPLAFVFQLRGEDWTRYMIADGYNYKYGQLLFYFPFILLIRNNTVLYSVLLAVNAVFTSLIPVCVFEILSKHLKSENTEINFLLSLTVGLLPMVTLNSKFTWAEPWLLLLPWVTILLLLKLMEENLTEKEKLLYSISLAFLQVYAFMVHRRGVVLLIAAILCVGFLRFVLKEKNIKIVPYLIASVVFLFCDSVLSSITETSVYGGASPSTNSAESLLLDGLFSIKGIGVWMQEIVGWLFTCAASSFGLAFLGLAIAFFILFSYLKRSRDHTRQELMLALFSLLFFAGSLTLGTLFFFGDIYESAGAEIVRRGDRLIYARYLDPATVCMCFIGLYAMTVRPVEKYKACAGAAIAAFAASIMYFVTRIAERIDNTILYGQNVMTINYFVDVGNSSRGGVYTTESNFAFGVSCFAVVSLVLFIVLLLSRKKPGQCFTFCFIVLLAGFFWNTYNDIYRESAYAMAAINDYADILESVQDSELKAIYLDDEIMRCSFQYRFSDYYVVTARDDNRTNIGNMFILSDPGKYNADLFSGDYYEISDLSEKNGNYHLYVKGYALKDALQETGYSCERFWLDKTGQSLVEFSEQIGESGQSALNAVYMLDSEVHKFSGIFSYLGFSEHRMETVKSSCAPYGKAVENSLFISTKDEHLDYIFEEFYSVSFDGLYMWGYGEDLKAELEAMEYLCEKRESSSFITYGNRLKLRRQAETDSAPDVGSSLYIQPGELQYGPYIPLGPGYYQIDICGKNLTRGNYHAWHNIGMTQLEVENCDITDTHVRYFVRLQEFSEKMEFICRNDSEEGIIVDALIVSPLQQTSQTSISQAESVFFRDRKYNISASGDFEKYINTNEFCDFNSTRYHMNSGGEIIIRDLPMPPGESHFELRGTNIQLADISMLGPDGNPLSFRTEAETDKTSLYAHCPEAVSIVIRNNTEELIDFSSLEIRWISSYS